jgi:hypothetical protein
MTLWQDVDERVLHWIFSLPPSFDDEHVFGLDTPAVRAALRLLYGT